MTHEKPDDNFTIEDVLDPNRKASDPSVLADSMTEGQLHDYTADLRKEIGDLDEEVAKLMSRRKALQVESSCAHAAIQLARDRGLE